MPDLALSPLEEAFFETGEQLSRLPNYDPPIRWWQRLLAWPTWSEVPLERGEPQLPPDDYASYEMIVETDYEMAA